MIRYPLRPQMEKKYLLPITMGIWMMGILPGIPYLVNDDKEKFVSHEICEESSMIKLCTPMISTQVQDTSVLVTFIIQVNIKLTLYKVCRIFSNPKGSHT